MTNPSTKLREALSEIGRIANSSIIQDMVRAALTADASDQAQDEPSMGKAVVMQELLRWNRSLPVPVIAISKEYAVASKVLELAARPAPVDEAPASEPVGEVVSIRERDGQAVVGLYGDMPTVGSMLYAAPDRAPSTQPEHEEIIREGDTLVCTACGTTSGAPSKMTIEEWNNSPWANQSVPSADSGVERDAARWRFMAKVSDNADGPESAALQEFARDEEDEDHRPESVQMAEVVDRAIAAMKGEGRGDQ